jgi:hypothetical protein
MLVVQMLKRSDGKFLVRSGHKVLGILFYSGFYCTAGNNFYTDEYVEKHCVHDVKMANIAFNETIKVLRQNRMDKINAKAKAKLTTKVTKEVMV